MQIIYHIKHIIMSVVYVRTAQKTRFNCNVLWCSKFGLALANSRYGEGTGAILLDDVNCMGNETSLGDCQHAGWGEHNCGHHEDVSVMCVDSTHITGN